MNTSEKITADVAGFSIIIGTMMQWLPPITAVLALLWALFRLAETQVVMHLWLALTGRRLPWHRD